MGRVLGVRRLSHDTDASTSIERQGEANRRVGSQACPSGAGRGQRGHDQPQQVSPRLPPVGGQWVLLGVASLYAHFYFKSFVETLAKRHADAAADLIRIRKNGKKTEAEVGLPGGESPIVILAEGMSDEAWLALFDIALAAEELRGKTLRWDSGTSTWRPADDH